MICCGIVIARHCHSGSDKSGDAGFIVIIEDIVLSKIVIASFYCRKGL
jgi:hypothetical protein